MKKVYIVHGYGGYPEKNWFPWLKSELEKLGVTVTVFKMPNTDTPQYSEWIPFLKEKIICNQDEEVCLVGHSLGCISILQYLNSITEDIKISGSILVAGFASPIHFTELNSFFDVPLNSEKIKKVCKNIIAINSDNDPHVPFNHAEELRDVFGAELITIHNGLHLNEKAGYKQFPLLLEKVKQVLL